MQTLWFITNPHSGSTSKVKCDAIEALFAERGVVLGGRTLFPGDPLPDRATLAQAGVDTIVLFAGDGTINAALCALADWDGAFLILPGGTMNMLAKQLHGPAGPAEIVHAAHLGGTMTALPYVEAGPHRAFVGLILGPVGHWARAREAVRSGRLRGLGRALVLAWRRTFGRGIRVAAGAGLDARYQAIFVAPHPDGIDVAAIDARDWRRIAELGWEWVSGDWIAAAAVTRRHVAELRLAGNKPALALFDGEPVSLSPRTRIAGGMSRRHFIRTHEAER